MPYEVEQKHHLLDPALAIQTLQRLGADAREPREQSDGYFSHPARDFRGSDEALRIRRQNGLAWLTYKGPKLDLLTKTRRELELPFAGEHAEILTEILQSLGFSPVLEVCKTRQPYGLVWGNLDFEVCLDHILGLGHFLELETSVEEMDELPSARTALLDLAQQFSLGPAERRSYLELLLENTP